MSYVRWINAHFLPVPCCTLGLSQLFTLVLFIHFLPSSRRRSVGRWLPLNEAADWGWCWGARFVRRPLARCAVFTFRVCVLPFQFVDHCELLLSMYTGNPLFNLQLEPYRRLSCFCIIFLFAHSINTCLQRAHISQTAGQFHRS